MGYGGYKETEKKKEHLEEENCQEDLWQRNYLNGQIRDMTRNIGKG